MRSLTRFEARWRWFADPDPDQDYLALATYIRLRSPWSLPRFQWYTRLVHRQLTRAPGLMGFSFRGVFPTRYWTLSVWESQQHLLGFVRARPHARIMRVLRASIQQFGSVRWQVTGSALPLMWAEALRRLEAREGPTGGAGQSERE